MAIERELAKFKNYQIVTSDDQDLVKEAFWINCLNFLGLFRTMEIILVKPTLLKKLKSRIIWKAFWESAEFVISGCRLPLPLIM